MARLRGLSEQDPPGRRSVYLAGAQVRKTTTPDQKIEVWSGFGYYEFIPKKADLFARFDSVKGDLGARTRVFRARTASTTGSVSTKQPFKTWIFGGEWYLHPSVRFSPNVEWVKYDNDPDPTKYSPAGTPTASTAPPSSGRSRRPSNGVNTELTRRKLTVYRSQRLDPVTDPATRHGGMLMRRLVLACCGPGLGATPASAQAVQVDLRPDRRAS
ncbi:MAG: hypothetical protein U0599_17050 [Vicinamibacteria bacterium]